MSPKGGYAVRSAPLGERAPTATKEPGKWSADQPLDIADYDNPGWSPAALRARGPSTWSHWIGALAQAVAAIEARRWPCPRRPVQDYLATVRGRPTRLTCAELGRGGRSCPP